MTQEQLREYNKLTSSGKVFYNQYMANHPEQSHAQAMSYAKICEDIGNEFPPRNGNSIKEIIEEAIRKAREFIRREIPRIFDQVRNAFDSLLSRLANAIEVTWETIKRWFRDIF